MLQLVFLFTVPLLLYYAYKSLRNTGYALAVVWSTYALEQFLQQANRIFVQYGYIINVAVVALALASVFNGLATGKIKRLRLSRAHLWWGGLLGLAFISFVWSVDSSITISKLKESLPYIFAFCVLAPYCAHDKLQINNAVNATVLLGGMVMLGMLFGNFGIRALLLSDGRNEIEANPLAVATYGGYVLICCGFSIYADKKNSLFKMLKIVIGVLAVYTMIRSGSRGQLFASLIACLLWIPITAQVALKKSSLTAIGFCCVFVLFAGYFIGGEEQLGNRWNSNRLQRDQSGRFEMAAFLLEKSYKKGPMAWAFGVGSSGSYALIGTYPHVVPLEILAEEGIVGLCFFIGFVLIVLNQGMKTMQLSNLDKTSRLNFGAMLSLFTFQCILCLKQGSLLGSPALFGVGLCIALAAERTMALSKTGYSMHRHSISHPSEFLPRGY